MLNRLPRILLLTGMAGGLGGCAALDGFFSGTSAPAARSAPEQTSALRAGKPATGAKKPSAVRPGKGTTAGNTKENTKEEEKLSAAAKEEASPQAEANNLNLVGLDQSDVAKVLGPPMAETDKAPGKVWRYWNSNCVVDVSLYLDVQSRSYRVLAYEVTNHDNSAGGKRACLAELPKFHLQPASYDGQ